VSGAENPPAFPAPQGWNLPGMSLRDWFAGQALSSIGAVEGYVDHTQLVADCYAVADAMLAERSKA
jgi:hypothetical protein